jgi:2-oxoglutarate dehydrogenase E2 component (dihydrolipoamide succinyltransferase)
MIIEVKVPSPGESIVQVQLARWLINDGDHVTKDADIAEIDSDKATLSITAEEEGKIRILVPDGTTVDVGTLIATISTETAVRQKKDIAPPAETKTFPGPEEKKEQSLRVSPLARKAMAEHQIEPQAIMDRFGGYRISRKDVEMLNQAEVPAPEQGEIPAEAPVREFRAIERQKMSTLRLKLSERLVSVKNETAMLTTFNEVDMTAIIKIRNQYKDAFKQKFGVSLGFMSFFTKAVTEALHLYPAVNTQIDGEYIVYHHFTDIGIAVSAPKGLVRFVSRSWPTKPGRTRSPWRK